MTTSTPPSRSPGGLWKKLAGRETLRRFTVNSAWLAVDNLFRLALAFFVGAWVARHLGPDRFGLLNFAVAFCAPFAALASLGLNAIAVRDLVRESDAAGEILGTVAGLKIAAGTLALLACGGAATAAGAVDGRSLVLILVTMAGTTLQSADVFDLWFQGQGLARVSAWVRSGAALALSGAKVLMILGDAPLVWFAAAGAFELALCAVGWALAYSRNRCPQPFRFSLSRCCALLLECWPVAVAGVAMQIQAYFDQVLLAGMRDASEVGHYAAALRLVAVFGFIPVAVSAAAAREITQAHQVDRPLYLRRLRDLYRFMALAFVGVLLPLVFFADQIVQVVFGAGFAAAAGLLPLLAWRMLLTNFGVVRGLYLTNEGMLRHAMLTAVASAVLNIALNVVLIPRWGAQGCIVAALVSFTVNTVLLEVLHPGARLNLHLMASAIGLQRLRP